MQKTNPEKSNHFFHETAEQLMGNPETKNRNFELFIQTLKNQKVTFPILVFSGRWKIAWIYQTDTFRNSINWLLCYLLVNWNKAQVERKKILRIKFHKWLLLYSLWRVSLLERKNGRIYFSMSKWKASIILRF